MLIVEKVLVEQFPGESEAAVRTAVDSILQRLSPSMPSWWHPYELRGTIRCADTEYREFYCIAGSVSLWLLKLASESNARKVLLVGMAGDVLPSAGH